MQGGAEMIINKKMWLSSWTNCHIVEISMERLIENETGHSEEHHRNGIMSHLSITRLPIYRQVVRPMDDFCACCMKCEEIDIL